MLAWAVVLVPVAVADPETGFDGSWPVNSTAQMNLLTAAVNAAVMVQDPAVWDKAQNRCRVSPPLVIELISRYVLPRVSVTVTAVVEPILTPTRIKLPFWTLEAIAMATVPREPVWKMFVGFWTSANAMG
jgi:hypothetical protein